MSNFQNARPAGLRLHLVALFRRAGACAPLIALFALVVLLAGLARALLVAWQIDRVMDSGIWPAIFLHGLRVDLILAGAVVALPLLLLPLLGHRYTWKLWKRVTFGWALVALVVILFLGSASPTFIAQYDVRPNRLVVEYLEYPREVFSTQHRRAGAPGRMC